MQTLSVFDTFFFWAAVHLFGFASLCIYNAKHIWTGLPCTSAPFSPPSSCMRFPSLSLGNSHLTSQISCLGPLPVSTGSPRLMAAGVWACRSPLSLLLTAPQTCYCLGLRCDPSGGRKLLSVALGRVPGPTASSMPSPPSSPVFCCLSNLVLWSLRAHISKGSFFNKCDWWSCPVLLSVSYSYWNDKCSCIV